MPNATVSFGVRGSLQSDTTLRLGLSGLFLKSRTPKEEVVKVQSACFEKLIF